MEKSTSRLFVEEETMRCLLCYDAPCSKVCPAETNPAKFIRSLRFKNEDGARDTIRKNNTFGASCSELCNSEKYCERACIRNKIDRPISIRYIQRYLMEKEEVIPMEEKIKNTRGKVYIVGADIKGLAAAAEFAKENYEVVVFSDKRVEEYIEEEQEVNESALKLLEKDIINLMNMGVKIVKEIPSLNKMVRGPNDYVYMIKKGKEAVRKIIEEVGGVIYEQAGEE